jgi:hypothetical protein
MEKGYRGGSLPLLIRKEEEVGDPKNEKRGRLPNNIAQMIKYSAEIKTILDLLNGTRRTSIVAFTWQTGMIR